jgi:hypothetical protein
MIFKRAGVRETAVLLVVGSGMVDRDETHKKFPVDVMR